MLWQASFLIPAPKKRCPVALNDYRPIALTSHIMKVMEMLVAYTPQTPSVLSQDILQFAYQSHFGVDDARAKAHYWYLTHLSQHTAAINGFAIL